MKLEIDVLNRYNSESCSLRLTVRDDDGSVSHIIEGPTRFVITRALKLVSPETKLALRKVHK